MSGSLTDQFVNDFLQVIADEGWCSLHYDSPALADVAFSEIFGGGYVRQRVRWSMPTSRAIWSMEPIRFTGLSAGSISHFGIWSAKNDGQLYAYGNLPRKALLTTGQGYAIDAGDLVIAIG